MKVAKFLIALLVICLGVSSAGAQDNVRTGGRDMPLEDHPVGVTVNTDPAEEGYVLIPMLQSHYTMLVSNDGRVVNYWESDANAALAAYLTPDGTLIRAIATEVPFGDEGVARFVNGAIEAYSWDGELLWTVSTIGEDYVGHHDFEILPNGNLLVVVFDRHTAEEAIAAGRNPNLMPDTGWLWSESILEIVPQSGKVVWRWDFWDHLIQDYDPTAANYGVVADHPEKLDINYLDRDIDQDWLHMNTVKYNADLDQIVMSSKFHSEIWIIDHSISTEDAKGSAGDLLYRWGNPEAYRAGTDADQQIVDQHDPVWIPAGYPGAGNILIFDNGNDNRPYSRVVEITPPLQADGTYTMVAGQPTEPTTPTWQYTALNPEDFYSIIISGAQRLENGNTLITSGNAGRIFEVTTGGEIVWEYYLPLGARVFRTERYDLTALGDFDQGQDLSADLQLNVVWGKDCVDGEQPRLHAYLSNEAESMTLFNNSYGADAQTHWEDEACAEHGGFLE